MPGKASSGPLPATPLYLPCECLLSLVREAWPRGLAGNRILDHSSLAYKIRFTSLDSKPLKSFFSFPSSHLTVPKAKLLGTLFQAKPSRLSSAGQVFWSIPERSLQQSSLALLLERDFRSPRWAAGTPVSGESSSLVAVFCDCICTRSFPRVNS